ncbi:hypothetical protein AB0K53_04375 [Streptomyces tuirus]|uniref:hypothetical protein n=1 Tax=Streptomyces tuirus TaxID=68278 RepID=UPI00343ABC1E
MGRYATAPALLTLLFTAACSGSGGGDATPPATSAASAGATPGGSSDAASSSAATPSVFDLPADAKVLMPVTEGDGDTDLPVFKPESDVYTIYATCTGKGKGKMTIVDRNAQGDDASKIGCNGPATIGRVYTDIVPQELSVRVKGGSVHWTLAVVSGEHPV